MYLCVYVNVCIYLCMYLCIYTCIPELRPRLMQSRLKMMYLYCLSHTHSLSLTSSLTHKRSQTTSGSCKRDALQDERKRKRVLLWQPPWQQIHRSQGILYFICVLGAVTLRRELIQHTWLQAVYAYILMHTRVFLYIMHMQEAVGKSSTRGKAAIPVFEDKVYIHVCLCVY